MPANSPDGSPGKIDASRCDRHTKIPGRLGQSRRERRAEVLRRDRNDLNLQRPETPADARNDLLWGELLKQDEIGMA